MTRLDAQLLSDLRQGLPEAVECWYKRYFAKLRTHLLNKVPVERDADELAQDAFLACLKHLPLFRGESSIWTWMVRVAQHEVADYYRKKYAKKVIHALPLSELLTAPTEKDAHEVAQKVQRVLLQLSAESRELLQQKYIDQKSVESLAKETGKTAKSIESLLFRARKEFKQRYSLAEL